MGTSRLSVLWIALVALGACVVLAVSGCGSSGSSSSGTTGATTESTTTEETGGASGETTEVASTGEIGEGLPENTSGAVPTLPKELQPFFKGLTKKLEPSPLGTSAFKPAGKPPYVIGYAATYSGDSWRTLIQEYLENVLLPKYQKLGLIKEVKVTQSELDIPTQIQNEKQLVDQGADAIVSVAPAPGLEKSVKSSFEHGVPFVSFDGGVETPEALATGVNYYLAGYEMAQGLAKEIGEEGDVVLVSGIPGTAGSDEFDAGAEKALDEFPNVNLVETVEGDWTLSVAKSEMLKFLGTHPQPLAGVVAQGGTETGVLEALKQTGREIPPITIGGEDGAMCYWKNNPEWIEHGYLMWPPEGEMDLAVRSILKTLLGQEPKIETITRPQFTLTLAEAEEMLPADCSEESIGWLGLEAEKWMSEEQLEGFFKNPFPLSEWKSHTGD